MKQELDRLFAAATAEISQISTLAELEALDTKYLGRKQGELTNLLKGLKDLSAEEKSTVGPEANRIKTTLEAAFAEKKSALCAAALASQLERERIDITEPPLPATTLGHLHPSTHLEREIEAFFTGLGFITLDGPELESDYYNFTAVNVPEHHPARDMQDTFYVKNNLSTDSSTDKLVMRTHTSSVQVRALQAYGAPLRAIIPGRCFRNEATDPRHEHTEPRYISDDMLRGHEDEIEARIRYAENFAPVTECGFVTNDDHGFVIGYSPDGLVDYDGLIECKSRRQKYQVETILADRVPEEYMLQIQTGLLVTRRKWLDFVSYCAGLPMFVKRVFPDARYQDAIIAAATDFERRLQEAHQKYAAWLDRQPVVINTERTIEEEITC
jgi:hypothetical protein